MTAYATLALWFTGGAVATAALLWILTRRRPRTGAVVATVLVLFALTAAFDSLMIASALFHYEEAHLLGARIGLAPVEDFAYPLAGAVLLPTLWICLTGRLRRDEGPS